MHMNSSMSHNRVTNPHCGSRDSLSYTSNKSKLLVNTITVISLVNKLSPPPHLGSSWEVVQICMLCLCMRLCGYRLMCVSVCSKLPSVNESLMHVIRLELYAA